MASNGYLQLGTAISGSVVVTPPGGTNYAGQPVTFDTFVGGVQLTNVNCAFGPVSGSWGTLTCFGITEDQAGTTAVVAPGTLQAPFTPLNGQIVVVPPGSVSIVVGSQFAAGPGFVANNAGPTTSGFVSLGSGAYSAVVASGARNALQLFNTSQIDSVRLIIGGASAPASGSVPSAIIPPFGSWPPAGSNFTTTDAVWATCGMVSGTVLSWIIG
jgi:hypothetical protein